MQAKYACQKWKMSKMILNADIKLKRHIDIFLAIWWKLSKNYDISIWVAGDCDFCTSDCPFFSQCETMQVHLTVAIVNGSLIGLIVLLKYQFSFMDSKSNLLKCIWVTGFDLVFNTSFHDSFIIVQDIFKFCIKHISQKQNIRGKITELLVNVHYNVDWLVQERCNSSALAMELRLSCTNPTIYSNIIGMLLLILLACL